jgi:type VI secretion system protein VasJ
LQSGKFRGVIEVELLSLGKEAISPDSLTGSDIRYDPDFEQLQAEMDKLSSPSASITPIDWGKVIELAGLILSKKSKDILVAGYLAVALTYTRKVEGLAIGLRIYSDLLDRFWEDLHPAKSRMKRRVGAIQWWMERQAAVVRELSPEAFTPGMLAGIKESTEQIEKMLALYLDRLNTLVLIREYLDLIPSDTMGEVQSAEPEAVSEQPVTSVPSELRPKVLPEGPQATVKPAAVPSGQGKAPPTERPEPPAQDVSAPSGDSQKVFNQGILTIRQAAGSLWQSNPSNHQAYRWTRLGAWLPLDDLPPSTDGRTRVSAPSSQEKSSLSELRRKGDWELLLKSSEARVPQHIFWLDLNRYTAEALKNLGSQYDRARKVVCQETALLLHRLPGIENLGFSDETPFADPETKNWLKGIRVGGGAALASSFQTTASSPTAGVPDMVAVKANEAQALADAGNVAEAVATLHSGLASSGSRKERLLWRLALCRVLLSSNNARLAMPHLEETLRDIETFRLDEWEPELALRGLVAVWSGLDCQMDEVNKAKAESVLDRIIKIDAVTALRLAKV